MPLTITGTLAELMASLPAILRAGAPVGKVEVSDKEPSPWDGAEFYFEENFWSESPHGIRSSIWDLMASAETTGAKCDNLIYPTADAARAALSDAILAWAEKQPAGD